MEQLPELKCLRCGHDWQSRVEEPAQCPKCHSFNWDIPPEVVKERNCPTGYYPNVAARQRVAV